MTREEALAKVAAQLDEYVARLREGSRKILITDDVVLDWAAAFLVEQEQELEAMRGEVLLKVSAMLDYLAGNVSSVEH